MSIAKCLRKVFGVALTIMLVLMSLSILPQEAQALNGFSYVAPCAGCATTAQFVAGAIAAAQKQLKPGAYTMISTSVARTALIKVTGNYCGCEGTPQLLQAAGVPIDTSGNSLASQSETTQEVYYGSLDSLTFGTLRNNPVLELQEPAYFPNSFIGSDDTTLSADIITWLEHIGVSMSPGGTITITFSDGTKAEFKMQPNGTFPPFKWTGKAWDKKGNPINRDGSAVNNPNTSGGGGGSINVPGIGNSSYIWPTLGVGSCSVGVSTEIDGEVFPLGSFVVPC